MRDFRFSVTWNLLLLTAGSFLIAFSVKAVAVPFGLLTGGMSGLALLMYYVVPHLSTGQWYFVLNVPVFVLGWIFVSRRFFLYSLYGMLVSSVFIDMITYRMPITDIWLAVFVSGALLGIGVGITLRSLGSTGGSDILAVIFKEKFNISVGTFEILFNTGVFLGGFSFLDLGLVLYSLAMTFVTAYSIEHCLGLFRERKMVMVVSGNPKPILQAILVDLDRGATILHGQGGYSGSERDVIMTMVNSMQLKRLEELIYNIDPDAFTIMGHGFNVFGRGFSARKVY